MVLRNEVVSIKSKIYGWMRGYVSDSQHDEILVEIDLYEDMAIICRMEVRWMALIMSFDTGMYLEEASEVPELKAKYLILPGQVTFFSPSRHLCHQALYNLS